MVPSYFHVMGTKIQSVFAILLKKWTLNVWSSSTDNLVPLFDLMAKIKLVITLNFINLYILAFDNNLNVLKIILWKDQLQNIRLFQFTYRTSTIVQANT